MLILCWLCVVDMMCVLFYQCHSSRFVWHLNFLHHLSFFFTTPKTGPPSEEHCYADIEAAYDYLRHYLKVPAKNIVLYGRSLGTGPSCYMAVKTAESKRDASSSSNHNPAADGPVGGLILHAPFLSVFRVVIDTGCTLPGDKFPNVDLINMVQSPTILVHGTNDQIVPFHHSERLYECIQERFRARPIYIQGMSHNNVHSQVRPLFCDRLSEYLEECVWPQVEYKPKHHQQHRNSTSSSSSRGGYHDSTIPTMRSSPNHCNNNINNKVRSRVWKIVDHELEYSHPDEKSTRTATAQSSSVAASPARLASALGI
jgi:abhydrolase domain-containing protein 17